MSRPRFQKENELLRDQYAKLLAAFQQVINDWHVRRDVRPAIDKAEAVIREGHQLRVDLGIPSYIHREDQDYVL